MDLKDFDINSIDFDNLTLDQRLEVEKIIAELEDRKLKWQILDVKLHDYQQEFDEAIKARKADWTPKYKFIIFLWWNGSGKTWYSAYTTMRIMMWKDLCKQFDIPYVWEASLVKIYTTTWDNIRDNIDRKYMLWTWSKRDTLKFPWYVNRDDKWPVVKKVRWDKEILKEVSLINWATATFGTYDQWQARLQGWEPQFTWMDELPTRFDDLIEIFRGTRNSNWQLLLSATPTNYNKKIHDYLFSWNFDDVLFVRQIDSLRNTEADHSWMEWLSEEDIKIRRYGSFTPPEWLVYPNFTRDDNVVKHIHPKKMWSNVRYFGAIDFWFNHPTAFLLIAVDNDWHIYVFDMFYKSKVWMREVAKWITEKKAEYWIELNYIIADSAGAQERHELKLEWYPTKGIKKKNKASQNSFRQAGIMKMNQLLSFGKIIISDKCTPIIDEFEVHHFKENWDVDKHEDDALDALRYFVTDFTAHSERRELERERRKIARKAQRRRKY